MAASMHMLCGHGNWTATCPLPCPALPPLPGQSAGYPAPPAWPECGLPCPPCLARVRAALPPLPGRAGCPASPAWPECGLPCLPCLARVRAALPPLPGQSAGYPASPAQPECGLPCLPCPARVQAALPPLPGQSAGCPPTAAPFVSPSSALPTPLQVALSRRTHRTRIIAARSTPHAARCWGHSLLAGRCRAPPALCGISSSPCLGLVGRYAATQALHVHPLELAEQGRHVLVLCGADLAIQSAHCTCGQA